MNQLLKSYNNKNKSIEVTKNNHRKLPYNIDDYDSIVLYDAKQYQDHLKQMKINKHVAQNLLRNDLDKQKEDKKKLKLEDKIKEQEIDKQLLLQFEVQNKIEKEKQENINKRNVDEGKRLEKIISDRLKINIDNFKIERRNDRESIKRYISDVDTDYKKQLERRKAKKNYYDNLKKMDNDKKSKEKERKARELEDDKKLLEENEKIMDKQDYIRKMQLNKSETKFF